MLSFSEAAEWELNLECLPVARLAVPVPVPVPDLTWVKEADALYPIPLLSLMNSSLL